MSDNGYLYVREAQYKATIHLGEGMKVSVKPNGGVLSEDGKTLTFESVTNIPYFEIAPDGDHYLPKSYKDAIKDMNSPLSASWYSNTRVQLSGRDSKLTKELELTLPNATAKDTPARYGPGGHDALRERHRLRLHHRHQQPDGVQQGRRHRMDDVQLLR